MIRLTVATLLVCTSVAHANEWTATKSTSTGNTVELKTLGRVVTLFWPSHVITGDDVLLIKSVDPSLGITFYLTYEFVGVVDNTLRITASGSVEEKGQKPKPDRSFSKELFFERSSDGAFYFTTSEIKLSGYLRVVKVSDRSPNYAVSLVKDPP